MYILYVYNIYICISYTCTYIICIYILYTYCILNISMNGWQVEHLVMKSMCAQLIRGQIDEAFILYYVICIISLYVSLISLNYIILY